MTGPSRVTLSDQLMLFGKEAAGARLREELAREGWRRLAVFASASMTRSGQAQRLRSTALADCEVVTLIDEIRGHAPIADTEAMAAELAGAELDALVAIGGGSVSDTAKGVAILLAEGGGLEEHCSVFRPPDHFDPRELDAPKLPVVAVVSTLSGAEVTPGGGATSADGVKRTFWDPKLACRMLAYDPQVLRDVPSEVLVSTAMNGLAHCAEGLYSRTANGVSSALATGATRHLASGLRAITRSDDWSDDSLDELGVGAAMSGLVITNARVGLHHAICHVLGAKCGVPHGVANSIMLPHVLRFNLPETRSAQEAFAQALAGDAAAKDPPATAADFQSQIGAPTRLRDAGVGSGQLDGIAADTMQDRGCYFNPRTVGSADAVREILQQAW